MFISTRIFSVRNVKPISYRARIKLDIRCVCQVVLVMRVYRGSWCKCGEANARVSIRKQRIIYRKTHLSIIGLIIFQRYWKQTDSYDYNDQYLFGKIKSVSFEIFKYYYYSVGVSMYVFSYYFRAVLDIFSCSGVSNEISWTRFPDKNVNKTFHFLNA